MALQVALHHETVYRYDRSVSLGPQVIRLRPAPHCRTRVTSYSLRVFPERHFLNWQQDPQGNFLARLVLREPTRELRVVVDLVAEIAALNPLDFFLEESAERWPFEYEPWLAEELEPFLKSDTAGPRLRAWLAKVDRAPTSTVAQGSRPASRRAIWFNWRRTSTLSNVPRGRSRIVATSTPGPRRIFRALVGSGSTRPQVCSRAKGTSPWPRARSHRRPPPSQGPSMRARSSSATGRPCAGPSSPSRGGRTPQRVIDSYTRRCARVMWLASSAVFGGQLLASSCGAP
jgi:hypothetical protein